MPLATDAPALLSSAVRDLAYYLDQIWQNYFVDIARVNDVHIDYCYPWKSRLGLIRLSLDQKSTFIGINSLLQLRQVPEYVLVTTIAHELTHYAHGFGSPLPRACKHPHANKVVERELERRNLGEQLRCTDAWIDKYWYPFYDAQHAMICSVRSAQRKQKVLQRG
ncbi:hypothetical protein EPA93_32790 [Ktedonosporobacter rubrisoli]|uniref:SprT-like domain-containing protein n=1 Tax=Ktedonosporobacter rubrisoli TaxID=2509675 RepID=A0A4P6JYA1_KTERU|nr:hypothetical protein [Ktedonosporobacter rubrisoli]QBD80495.1 hypothetical protein EPA93_32790 [Ktedonosporobacter rubrisoli]